MQSCYERRKYAVDKFWLTKVGTNETTPRWLWAWAYRTRRANDRKASTYIAATPWRLLSGVEISVVHGRGQLVRCWFSTKADVTRRVWMFIVYLQLKFTEKHSPDDQVQTLLLILTLVSQSIYSRLRHCRLSYERQEFTRIKALLDAPKLTINQQSHKYISHSIASSS